MGTRYFAVEQELAGRIEGFVHAKDKGFADITREVDLLRKAMNQSVTLPSAIDLAWGKLVDVILTEGLLDDLN